VANYVPLGMEVILQSENGMLGVGPYPWDAEVDPDLINAGKETISELAGSCYFSSADSWRVRRVESVPNLYFKSFGYVGIRSSSPCNYGITPTFPLRKIAG